MNPCFTVTNSLYFLAAKACTDTIPYHGIFSVSLNLLAVICSTFVVSFGLIPTGLFLSFVLNNILENKQFKVSSFKVATLVLLVPSCHRTFSSEEPRAICDTTWKMLIFEVPAFHSSLLLLIHKFSLLIMFYLSSPQKYLGTPRYT